MTIPFVLDRELASPLHRQIYDRWKDAILTGRFHRGERVPSTRAFATAHGIARVTVASAYDQLLAEGYLETRHGAGTFVSGELPDEALRPAGLSLPAGRPSTRPRLSAYGVRLPEIPRLPESARPLNLSRVGPDLARFPFALWRRLVSRHLRNPESVVFDPGGQAAGHPALRAAIAGHVARWRAIRCDASQVIVCSGSQQVLDLCARLLLDSGDEAAVEEPGYAGARTLFRLHGAKLRHLPVDDDGVTLDGLTSRTRLVHVTPSHQFPTGVSLSLPRRLELVDWARSRGAMVIEDDYDSEYRYSGAPLPAVYSLADDGNVVYVGTFSTVMFRGLRIGYLIVPKDLIRPFTIAKWMADRHTTFLEQAALAEFMTEGHFERHIRRMRRVYKERRDVLLDALSRHFGDGATVRGEAAGLHLTVRFGGGHGVKQRAERAGVHLAGTGLYYANKPAANEFIFGFAATGERTLREGVRRLAA
jgi:GntR family transcriptional regulator/MocR family aminotransferase